MEHELEKCFHVAFLNKMPEERWNDTFLIFSGSILYDWDWDRIPASVPGSFGFGEENVDDDFDEESNFRNRRLVRQTPAAVAGAGPTTSGLNGSLPPQDASVRAANVSNWPLKRTADIPGDIFLGGLHMVHERSSRLTCGPIMPQGGVQVRNRFKWD